MYPSADSLCLSIDGIDNAFEASGLVRLFNNVEPKLLSSPGKWGRTPAREAEGCACVVRLEVEQTDRHFSAEAKVYRNGVLAGTGSLGFSRDGDRPSATLRHADLLLKSPKLCAGTAMHAALSEAFGFRLPWGSLTGVRPVKLASGLLSDGWRPEDAVAVLVDRTGMSLEKARLLVRVACNEQPCLQAPANSVSVYVGIPFCATRCLYCSFPAYSVERMGSLIPGYLEALDRELRFLGEWLTGRQMGLSTVYVGGGTPTALPGKALERLFQSMRAHLPLGTASEFTVEAGRPDTLDPDKLACIREAGATRISINPQSMRDETLRRIGRAHTARDVVTAFEMARNEGFANINADLIAGLPGETVDDFKHTLSCMGALRPDSLTIHTLAVKRASRLNEQVRGGEMDNRTEDGTVMAMLAEAAAHADAHGLEPYYLYRQKNILANLENIGYARSGCGCRYNVETMSERQTILAAGSGAITKISHDGRGMERVFNVRELSHYVERIGEMIEKKRELLERHYPD